MSNNSVIHSHWHHHFEEFSCSTSEFYESLKKFVEEYQFPKIDVSTVSHSQGFFEDKRDYLCIRRDLYSFEVCAAPFGKSFFVSWWLREESSFLQDLFHLIPLIGGWLAQRSQRKTFFQVDSETMFKESIHNIVLRAVENLGTAHGFRFSDEARKIQPYKTAE